MSAIPRRSLPPRPYASRPVPTRRPYYGPAVGARPGVGGASTALTAALGAIGSTLGCLLCLSAIGALGLFSCLVALTAYASQFLDKYKQFFGINGGLAQAQIGFSLLFASLLYLIVIRLQQRN